MDALGDVNGGGSRGLWLRSPDGAHDACAPAWEPVATASDDESSSNS